MKTFGAWAGMVKEQKGEVNITGDDVREGLVAVVSVRLPQPQFEGQTKGKLNSDIKGDVEQLVNEKLGEWFDKHSTVAPHYFQVHRRGARPRSSPQGARTHTPQIRHGFERLAGETRRLPGTRASAVRTVRRRRRIRRRLGQAGARPQASGHPAAHRQNPKR